MAAIRLTPTTKAVAVPIYQTVAFALDNTQHGADLFDLKVAGNIYSRIMNPTNGLLDARLAALEDGVGAPAVASGMSAVSYAIQTVTDAGDNAPKIARHLKNNSKVAWVNYAGLPGHRDHALVQEFTGGRASGIISFGLKSGDAIAAGSRFQDALQLFTRLVNIGEAKSLACTTHRQLNESELARAGVSADMVRLSIGIEHIDDLLADLKQAFAAV